MADDLSLLFRLRAQNQASPVIHQVQGDVSKLASTTTSQFNAMQQVSTTALGKITQSLTGFSNQLPVVGNAVSSLTSEMSTMATSTEAAGTEFAALAGPIGIAVVATAAMAVGVVKLGEALFDVAKLAGDAQGKLFDLSQQTGVSVETLSALDLLAKTTGGNIDSLAQSLVEFQGNLEAAQDPTSKQAALFARLGVDIGNTEDALRQALAAIAKLPEGFHQTNEAAELFGRRGGKQFLAILKESHGDIDQTIRELQELGLANTANAKQADEFNDQLVKLQTQLLGISVTVGNQVIPQILAALKDLEKLIKDNKEAIDALATAVKVVTFLFAQPFKGAIVAATGALTAHAPELKLVVALYERLAEAVKAISASKVSPNAIPRQSTPSTSGLDLLREVQEIFKSTPQLGAERPDFGEGILKKKNAASSDPAATAQRVAALTLANTVAGLNAEEAAIKRSLENRKVSFAEYVESIKTLESARHSKILAGLQAEQDAAEKLRKSNQREVQLAEIKNKIQQEEIRHQGVLNDLSDRQTAITNKIVEAVEGLKKQWAEASVKSSAFQNAVNALVKSLNDEGIALDKNQEFWLRFNAQIADSIERLQRLHKTFDDVIPDINHKLPDPGKFIFDDSSLGPPPEAVEGFKDLQHALDDLGESFGNLFGASENFKTDFGDVINGAIADMAFGIGSLVENWVLLGETGPAAMRKLTASVLAGLAAQAATKAVFQLAEGFAALFWNPAEAGAHFASAALFASIAGVAAIAGRKVAGDLFKQPSAGGSQGAGSGNGQLNPITLNRNQANSTRTIVLQVQSNDSHIVKVVGGNIREAGELREIIFNDQ